MSMFSKLRKTMKRDYKNDLEGRRKRFFKKYDTAMREERMVFKSRVVPLPENPALFQVINEAVDATKLIEELDKREEQIKKDEELKLAEENIKEENKQSK